MLQLNRIVCTRGGLENPLTPWPSPPTARGPMQGNPAVGVWPAATPGLFSRQLSRSTSASIMSVAGEGYAGPARNGWELSPFTGMPLAIRAGRPRLSYPPPPPSFPPPKQPPGPHTLVCPPRGLVPVRLAALPNSKTSSSTALGRSGSRCRHSYTCTQRLPGLPSRQPGSTGAGPHHRPAGRVQHYFSRQALPSWQRPPGNQGRVFAEVRARRREMQATKGLLLVSHNLEGSDRTHRLDIVEEPQYKSPCF